ncbi:TVP38/TMEM64 family protein [Lutibacter sp. B2]|nr:TVP38/TMEM64 family protein [Lutibacter sp. B2]
MKLNRRKKIIIIVALFIIAIVVCKFPCIMKLLTLENLKNNRYLLDEYVKHHYIFSVLIYIATAIFIMIFGMPVIVVISVTGGVLFGTFEGALYSDLGITIGSSISFLVARYFMGDWVQKKYSDKLRSFNEDIKENGKNYFLMVRFVLIIPSFLINLFAGISKISLWTFLWTTFVGNGSEILIYAFAGNKLSQIQSVEDIISPEIIIAFIFLGLMAVIPTIIKKYRKV